MNINDIELSIRHLENSGTSYENCEKLASLYILRDHYSGEPIQGSVVSELSDILPAYQEYIKMKKDYQLGKITEKAIENKIKCVCLEIRELVQVMYFNSDMEVERIAIKEMIQKLAKKLG